MAFSSTLRRSVPAFAVAAAALLLPAGAAGNPWLDQRVLNMAHQGGEDELPSNTMYALRTSIRRGADMLELDVGVTKDRRVVVLHDGSVDRTTNGTGRIEDLTLRQIQRLDAAYRFVPGRNAVRGLPAARYPLRGIRTGERRPPRGFTARDFRIPSLDEVLRAFPGTPINIEIKGRDGAPEVFRRGAEVLAPLLRRTGRRDLIVVSFDQAAVDRFHALAPRIPIAPGITGVAGFVLGGGTSLAEGVVALQVPITFTTGGTKLTITTPGLVRRAHEAGVAVHVWLSNDVEDAATYRRLLAMCADAIMAAKPLALERLMAREGIARPGGRGDDPCTTGAASTVPVAGTTATVTLRRRGLSRERRTGTVTLRAVRPTGRGLPAGALLGGARYVLASDAASAEVALRLTARARAALRRGALDVLATTTDAHGAPLRRPVRLVSP